MQKGQRVPTALGGWSFEMPSMHQTPEQPGDVAHKVRLLYAKGGAAVTGNGYRILDAATGALAATASDDSRRGGTIGAGVEVGFAPNWSVGVKYDHLFMQDSTVAFTTPAGAGFSDCIHQDVDVVTAHQLQVGGPVVPSTDLKR